MNITMNLRWGVIVALALFGLLGPLLGILGVYENFDGPWAPILVTVLIAAVWVGVVVVQRIPNPLVTLVAVGGIYGVFVILFQIIGAFLGKIPEGEIPAGPLMVIGWISIVVTNMIWGAVLGLVALGLRRLLSSRDAGASF